MINFRGLAAVCFMLFSSVVHAQDVAKTLVFCSEASPEGFMPMLHSSGTTFDASSQPMYDGLFRFEESVSVPNLVVSYEISKDGLVYDFILRKDVPFHTTKDFKPTRNLNAEDVIFTFKRQIDKNHPYYSVSGGSYYYASSMGFDKVVKDVVKLGDHHVRLILKEPDATMIGTLAMDFLVIVSEEYASQLSAVNRKQDFDYNPVGTGPFEFVSYQKDLSVRYRAFQDYFRGKTPVDRLVFSITPDASVRSLKLQSGECHVSAHPNPADIPLLKAHKDVEVLEREGLNVGYLSFQTKKKPFSDMRVRKALAMALDKQAIVDAVFLGTGVVAHNPIPPGVLGYVKDLKPIPYSIKDSMRLLKEAGYVAGFDVTIWAMPVSRPYNPNAIRMAEIIQSQWAKVGVRAKIVTYEWGEYLRRTAFGEHDVALLGWTGDNGDPDNFLGALLSCKAVKLGNVSQFCDKIFDDLIVQARRISNIGQREKLYNKAILRFQEQVPFIPIAHAITASPIRKEVKNYKMSLFGLHDFYNVDIESGVH